jgi:hypothetical protein
MSSPALRSSDLAGDFNVQKGVVDGPRGGEAAGITVEGPRGNEVARGIGAGPEGRVAGGTAVRGADGNAAARGFVAGPSGFAAGFTRVTPSGRYTTAAAVRRGVVPEGIYGARWYTAHPAAWYAAGWAAGAAYATTDWAALAAWLSYANAAPTYYDYGNNVTYQDNQVYVNNEDVGTADQYTQQAAALAQAGTQAQAPPQQDWLPLGVFALCKPGNPHYDVVLQLAVNHDGILRGNYTDTKSNRIEPIHGSVDKQTQRVAFTVGDNRSTVLETGLYNLTKDEAPALIHVGKDRTEQWLLVRLKSDQGSTANGGTTSAAGTTAAAGGASEQGDN